MDNYLNHQLIYNKISAYFCYWLTFLMFFSESSFGILNKILAESRQRTSQLILNVLIETTEDNSLLNIGPVLRLLNQRNRTMWTKTRSDDWWTNIVMKKFDDSDWNENFRMRKETFLWLCEQLRTNLTPNNSVKTREPVSVEKQVAITLYFLASCCEYRIVGNAFGVHKSTVCKCVHNVIFAINNILGPNYLSMPSEAECQDISYHFEKLSKIPQLMGAIDGSHIPILPPSDGYRDFINRKQWPSIVLQAVVDHKYRFRNINCQSPGSAHDAAVFKNSSIFRNHKQLIPQGSKTVNDTEIPYMIVGDPAYPLLSWLIKGYTRTTRLGADEESFNVYLSSARVAVEIAFGRLKARWRCLLKRIDVHYSFVPHVVAACCVLHNIVETNKENFVSAWITAVEEAELEFAQPGRQNDRTLPQFEGSIIRDSLKDYLAGNFPMRKSFI